MKNIKIFSAHHKAPIVYKDDCIIPIFVGKNGRNVGLDIIGDDTGDNISEKNSNYAELTAQYRVWKNYDLSDVDYVGFCHYRRYFSFGYRPSILLGIKTIFKNFKTLYERLCFILFYILGIWYMVPINQKVFPKISQNVQKYIEKSRYDIYLSRPTFWRSTFHHLHLKSDELRDVLRKIILDNFPEYDTAIKNIDKKRQYHPWNMYIMKKEIFNGYCNWLFTILFSFESEVENKKLVSLLKDEPLFITERYMGYVGEILLNLYLEQQKIMGKTMSTKFSMTQFMN